MIHPGVGEEAPLEILDILEAAGADVSHTVIAHMDRTVFRDKNVLRLARRGCYIEYDLFGIECSHYQVYRLLQVYIDNHKENYCFFSLLQIKIFHPMLKRLKR